ncbi:MAG: histidine kinase [Candidatus Omnitrophica bacterium]|nr:histidine kinase [Candidatus Omnitrophota bacterium]
MRSRNFLPAFLFLVFVAILLISFPVGGLSVSKEELLDKYEKAISLAEELNVYQEDILQILPKIRVASKALLRDNFEQANRLLDEALSDLNLLQAKRPRGIKAEVKLEWLEIYIEVLQKYAVLALLAYFLIRWPFFGKMLKTSLLSLNAKTLLSVFMSFFAILLSFLDFARYGESAWAFFDIQIVLITVSGLLGGAWAGLFSGMAVALFRWFLKPELPIYVAMAVAAGVLSGIFSHKIRNIQSSRKIGFGIGFFIGLLHGIVAYLPTIPFLPLPYVFFSVFFLALLEGTGVFIFLAVIGGVLREEARKEMENELLKTRLLFLQAQMKPHFLFNALNTIAAICGQENAQKARNLILRLSDFFRRTVKEGDEMVSLKEEFSYINSYLEIEKARFQNRLNIERNIDIEEASWSTQIPLLIFQPLIENAVQHGISKKETGGTLRIHITDKDNMLTAEIMDDGVGIDPSLVNHLLKGTDSTSGKLGIGVRNVHQRLIRLYGSSYGLRFESQPGRGTKVIVKMPLTIRKDER